MEEAKQLRILYMEDDPGLARLVQKRLGGDLYRTETVPDGRQGIERIDEAPFDIVIVDHEMPEMSGLEVIRALSDRDEAPPVIMLTGAGSERTAVAALKEGAAEYVIKDVDGSYLDLLPTLVGRVVEQRRLREAKLAAERALRESEARYRTLFEQANDAILVEDAEGRIIDVNLRACEMLGFERDALLAMTAVELETEEMGAKVRETVYRGNAGREFAAYETALSHVDGQPIPVEIGISRLSDVQGQLLLSIIRDISERKRFEAKLTQMAHHDSLTGVFNRHYLHELLDNESARAERYDHAIGLLMIDINRFKEINDRHGHQMGDRVLQRIAGLLQKSVRGSDRIVRYGGDEFLIILPETSDGTEILRHRIQSALVAPDALDLDFPVSLSIGAAQWRPGDGPIEKTVGDADERMYEEKRSL